MALKPRVRPDAAATPKEKETPPITSRERTAPVVVAEEVDEQETKKVVDTSDADEGLELHTETGDEGDADSGTPAGDADPDVDLTPTSGRRQRTTTPPPGSTEGEPKVSPKERLSELRRELKALNSEELATRKALDAEFGARRKALRSEYDLLTKQETASLFGDEPEA